MGCQLSKVEISAVIAEPESKSSTAKSLTPRADPEKRFLTWNSDMSSSWDSMEDQLKPAPDFDKLLKRNTCKIWNRKSWTSSAYKDQHEYYGSEDESSYRGSYNGRGEGEGDGESNNSDGGQVDLLSKWSSDHSAIKPQDEPDILDEGIINIEGTQQTHEGLKNDKLIQEEQQDQQQKPNEGENDSEARISPEKLKEIQKYKFIGKGHGLNPDGIKVGEGAQQYLKSLLPQIQV